MTNTSTNHRPIVGWREYVGFPEWGIRRVEAKVDTGARTSALHVDNVKRLTGDRVAFEVVLSRENLDKRTSVVAKIARVSRVRSSNGHQQTRYVVETTIRIGHARRRIETSLVCRKHMLCRMLLGRTALSGFLIDVDLKHEQGPPRSPKRRKKAL